MSDSLRTITQIDRPSFWDHRIPWSGSCTCKEAGVRDGSWHLPTTLPDGDLRIVVPPVAGLNERTLYRAGGQWYVQWPGFSPEAFSDLYEV